MKKGIEDDKSIIFNIKDKIRELDKNKVDHAKFDQVKQ